MFLISKNKKQPNKISVQQFSVNAFFHTIAVRGIEPGFSVYLHMLSEIIKLGFLSVERLQVKKSDFLYTRAHAPLKAKSQHLKLLHGMSNSH